MERALFSEDQLKTRICMPGLSLAKEDDYVASARVFFFFPFNNPSDTLRKEREFDFAE